MDQLPSNPQDSAEELFRRGYLTQSELDRVIARISKGGIRSRFQPPEREEVLNYFKWQGVKDHEASAMTDDFYDFYSSKGWLVGNQSMKDWKASARRWFRGNNGKGTQGSSHNSAHGGASKGTPRGIPSGAGAGGHNLGELFRRGSR